MIGAARSARQNIVEGSSRAGTSRETELKLYDVARGSLDELAGDYEVFLEESNALPWTPASPEADEFLKIKFNPFEFQGDEAQERHEYARFFQTIRQFFSPWIENEDSIRAANSILLLIDQARRLLAKQIVSITVAITEQGGFTEQLSHARIANRKAKSLEPDDETIPRCPKCGLPMRKNLAKRGKNAGNPFWGCVNYPNCLGTRKI